MRRGLLVALGLLAIPLTYLQASHNFSDVPDSAIYHRQVEWLVNRGVTTGCSAGLYCPDANVTRAQMAIFMRNLGVALTPTPLISSAGLGAYDLDSATARTGKCSTVSYTPTFPQRAILYPRVSLAGTVAFAYWIYPAVSLDGGTTWGNASGQTFSVETSVPATNQQFPNFNTGYHDLIPGTTYRFGIQTFRAGGTGDPTGGWCSMQVEIVNRNPGAGPAVAEEETLAAAEQQALSPQQ